MGRFSGFLRLPQQGHIYAVSSMCSSFLFHILCYGSGPLPKYAIKSLPYCPLNTQQLSYGMMRKAMLNPSIWPPANLTGYSHSRSPKRMKKKRTHFRTLVFRYPPCPFHAKLRLIYHRWTHVILHTPSLLLSIRATPQSLLLVSCMGRLRKYF